MILHIETNHQANHWQIEQFPPNNELGINPKPQLTILLHSRLNELSLDESHAKLILMIAMKASTLQFQVTKQVGTNLKKQGQETGSDKTC